MTISELIERLEALKAEHGDLRCYISAPSYITEAVVRAEVEDERLYIEAY